MLLGIWKKKTNLIIVLLENYFEVGRGGGGERSGFETVLPLILVQTFKISFFVFEHEGFGKIDKLWITIIKSDEGVICF